MRTFNTRNLFYIIIIANHLAVAKASYAVLSLSQWRVHVSPAEGYVAE